MHLKERDPMPAGAAAPSWRWLALCSVIAAAQALTGCASSGRSGDDLPTASDTTPTQQRAQIRMQLALGYLERGQPEVALDEVKKAIAADPSSSSAYNLRGLIYSQIGDKALAEESLRRAVSLNARDGDAQHNLGWLLCEQGRTKEGLQVLDQALANPSYVNKPRTRVAKGLCELRGGNAAAAESLLLSAYDELPQNGIAAAALAELYAGQGDLRKAAMYASQANVKGGATPASLWTAMKIEHRLGNGEAVARYARQLEDSFPQSREMRLYERGAWND